MTEMERRTLIRPVEFRALPEGGVSMRGYAAVFGSRSQNLGGFREVIDPGAFTEYLRTEPDILALVNHDPNRLLGRTASGTLRLSVDEVGLAYDLDLPDTSEGRDLAVLLERRDITGSSFTFRVAPDGGDTWTQDEDGTPLRTVRAISAMRDVGPVTSPAYLASEAALVAARSMTEALEGAEAKPLPRRRVLP